MTATFVHNVAPDLAKQFAPGAALRHSANAASPVLKLAQDVQNRVRGMSASAIAKMGADALSSLQGALATAQAAFEREQSSQQVVPNGSRGESLAGRFVEAMANEG